MDGILTDQCPITRKNKENLIFGLEAFIQLVATMLGDAKTLREGGVRKH